jgi:hypothetical protein
MILKNEEEMKETMEMKDCVVLLMFRVSLKSFALSNLAQSNDHSMLWFDSLQKGLHNTFQFQLNNIKMYYITKFGSFL